jgi:hypothetical protein
MILFVLKGALTAMGRKQVWVFRISQIPLLSPFTKGEALFP